MRDREEDGRKRREGIAFFAHHAGVTDPDGELAPVAGLEGDWRERETGLEVVRQPGGTGFVVSNDAVANLDGLHGISCRHLECTVAGSEGGTVGDVPSRMPRVVLSLSDVDGTSNEGMR